MKYSSSRANRSIRSSCYLRVSFSVAVRDVGPVARLGVGEIVGEMSIVNSAPPSATVAAEGECLILLLDKKILLQKLTTDAPFGCRFYNALAVFLADRLREMGHRLSGNDEQDLAAETISKDRAQMSRFWTMSRWPAIGSIECERF